MILIFLTSGLFLGWSLGANDAANVFGTAVGTKMLRFKTAAIIASVFVVIGSVVGGAGASDTLGKLGAVNALAGSFMVALGAAFTVFMMTKFKIPVSTSQAIVGAIIGWNFFSDTLTDYSTLSKIVSTWVLCPVISAVFAIVLFWLSGFFLSRFKLHLLREDIYIRISLILVGAFGSYSLGANNIANVMGVFVPAVPFDPINVYGLFTLSAAQQLFFLGSIAIAVGILTYSYKVMDTVGGGIMKLSPVAAFVIVLSQSLVLFLFSSEGLENWLAGMGMPTIPLVPVSSSQAVVGAVLGIGIVRGGKGIRFNVLRGISSGWVTTPVIAGLITFIGLFFLQNVFSQTVSHKREYVISPKLINYLENKNLADPELIALSGQNFQNAVKLASVLEKKTSLTEIQIRNIIKSAQIFPLHIDENLIHAHLDKTWFRTGQINGLTSLAGKNYDYTWEFSSDLADKSDEWKLKADIKSNKLYNKDIQEKLNRIFAVFKITPEE